MDSGERPMKAAKHRMSMKHLGRIIRPMPVWLRLRAIQHVEALPRARRRLRQGVKKRRAVRSGDVGQDDETHRFWLRTWAQSG